jgi:hypothetical protein
MGWVETVAKMGHRDFDVGHPANDKTLSMR